MQLLAPSSIPLAGNQRHTHAPSHTNPKSLVKEILITLQTRVLGLAKKCALQQKMSTAYGNKYNARKIFNKQAAGLADISSDGVLSLTPFLEIKAIASDLGIEDFKPMESTRVLPSPPPSQADQPSSSSADAAHAPSDPPSSSSPIVLTPSDLDITPILLPDGQPKAITLTLALPFRTRLLKQYPGLRHYLHILWARWRPISRLSR